MTLPDPSPLHQRAAVTAGEAADALVMARIAMHRGRSAAVGQSLRAPLVYWGVAWVAGYAAAQFLPGWLAYLVWFGFTIGWLAVRRAWKASHDRRRVVVSGWEAQIGRAWWIILLGSVAMPLIVEPVPTVALYLLFGALWGIAYMLYAVIVEDRALGFLGASVVALAVILRLFVPDLALLLYGLSAGGSTIIFGAARMRRQW